MVAAANTTRAAHGFCKELVEHRKRYWTFINVECVKPANNAAEQALRHAVIWRKLSFGTQSASGSQFVEPLLSVIETCRRQSHNIFAWLVTAVQAHYHRHHQPVISAGHSVNGFANTHLQSQGQVLVMQGFSQSLEFCNSIETVVSARASFKKQVLCIVVKPI